MNTALRRWRIVVPVEDEAAWEAALVALSDWPVEGIVELEGRAEVYFAERAAADEAALLLLVEPAELSSPGGGEVFGQSAHATTELCLELMAEVVRSGNWVVDVGSGTGKLAARALELGAGVAVALDVDWPAASASKHVVKDAVQGSVDAMATERFDVVLANLHLALWRELAAEIGRVANAEARLVASGFLEEQESEVREMLAGNGWRVEKLVRREYWLGVTCKRHNED